jgi:hypothetical protein
MAYYLKFTDEAADLLLSHAKWYLETSQSPEVAIAWYDGFLDALESLEQNPWRGCLAAENELFMSFGMRLNSNTLCVTKVIWWATQIAAIIRSFGPII